MTEIEPIYSLKGKRVWVAGHNGMVGSALVRRLAQIDCTLLTIARTDLDLTRHCGIADRAEHGQIDHVIFAQALRPLRKLARDRGTKAVAAFEFHAMTLSIVEPERLYRLVAIKRPGKARGRVLAAGKQHERAVFSVYPSHRENSVLRE